MNPLEALKRALSQARTQATSKSPESVPVSKPEPKTRTEYLQQQIAQVNEVRSNPALSADDRQRQLLQIRRDTEAQKATYKVPESAHSEEYLDSQKATLLSPDLERSIAEGMREADAEREAKAKRELDLYKREGAGSVGSRELSEEEINKLDDTQSRMLRFNNMLRDAVAADEDLQKRDKKAETGEQYAANEELEKSIFPSTQKLGSRYAPNTLALLKNFGITSDSATLEDYLTGKRYFTASDFERVGRGEELESDAQARLRLVNDRIKASMLTQNEQGVITPRSVLGESLDLASSLGADNAGLLEKYRETPVRTQGEDLDLLFTLLSNKQRNISVADAIAGLQEKGITLDRFTEHADKRLPKYRDQFTNQEGLRSPTELEDIIRRLSNGR